MGVAMPHFDVWFLLYDEVLWILLRFWSKEFVLYCLQVDVTLCDVLRVKCHTEVYQLLCVIC